VPGFLLAVRQELLLGLCSVALSISTVNNTPPVKSLSCFESLLFLLSHFSDEFVCHHLVLLKIYEIRLSSWGYFRIIPASQSP